MNHNITESKGQGLVKPVVAPNDSLLTICYMYISVYLRPSVYYNGQPCGYHLLGKSWLLGFMFVCRFVFHHFWVPLSFGDLDKRFITLELWKCIPCFFRNDENHNVLLLENFFSKQTHKTKHIRRLARFGWWVVLGLTAL